MECLSRRLARSSSSPLANSISSMQIRVKDPLALYIEPILGPSRRSATSRLSSRNSTGAGPAYGDSRHSNLHCIGSSENGEECSRAPSIMWEHPDAARMKRSNGTEICFMADLQRLIHIPWIVPKG